MDTCKQKHCNSFDAQQTTTTTTTTTATAHLFVVRPSELDDQSRMKERTLFHLRLGDSSPRLDNLRRNTTVVPSEALPENTEDGNSNEAKQQGGAGDHSESLVCTCIHSSSASSVAIGFEAGVVHLYDRLPDDGGGGSQSCEEERWKRSVLYPTKSLNAVVDPISSPPAPPDITCLQRGPGGMMAVGTSNGFVFVTQVIRFCDGTDSTARLVPVGPALAVDVVVG